jgi:hypothetical protein
VQRRILSMKLDEREDAMRNGFLERQTPDHPGQREEAFPNRVVVTAADLGDQRLLVREVLIEGPDSDSQPSTIT